MRTNPFKQSLRKVRRRCHSGEEAPPTPNSGLGNGEGEGLACPGKHTADEYSRVEFCERSLPPSLKRHAERVAEAVKIDKTNTSEMEEYLGEHRL